MKRLLACCLVGLAALSCGGPVRADEDPLPIEPPGGGLRQTAAADFVPRGMIGPGFMETWNYLFFLEDDLQVHVRFSQANLGSIKGKVCGAALSVVGFDGENYDVAREYPIENLEYRAEDQSLRVHRNLRVSGIMPESHHLHFETAKDGVSYLVDLAFSEIRAGLVWGDGIFRLGEEESLGLFVHLPYARVSGSVTVNSVRKEVRGTAYMDHIYQTTWLSHLFSSGFRYVKHDGVPESGYLLVPSARFQPGVVGYAVADTGGDAKLLKPVELSGIESGEKSGETFGRRIGVRFLSGRGLQLDFTDVRQRLSVLDDVGALGKIFARAFLRGEVVQLRGSGLMNGADPCYLDYFYLQ